MNDPCVQTEIYKNRSGIDTWASIETSNITFKKTLLCKNHAENA